MLKKLDNAVCSATACSTMTEGLKVGGSCIIAEPLSHKVLATLIRLLRDFDLAEEALHDAFLIGQSSGQGRADRAPRGP